MPQPAASKFSIQLNRVLDCISLKVIFSIHFILLSIALTVLNWVPAIFLYYNSLFLLLLLWSIHHFSRLAADRNSLPISADILLLAAVVNGTSIICDIICICTMYDLVSPIRRFAPSFVFIILNLVVRPFSTFVLTRLYYSKSIASRFGPHALSETNASSVDHASSPLSGAIRKILLLDATSNSGASESYRDHQHQHQQQHQQHPHQPAHRLSQQLSEQQHKRVSSLQLMSRPVISLNTHQQHSTASVQSQSVSTAVSATAPAAAVQSAKQNPDSISLASALSISELSTASVTIEPVTSSSPPLPAPRQSPSNNGTANRQSTYIDPETGETFQERMI